MRELIKQAEKDDHNNASGIQLERENTTSMETTSNNNMFGTVDLHVDSEDKKSGKTFALDVSNKTAVTDDTDSSQVGDSPSLSSLDNTKATRTTMNATGGNTSSRTGRGRNLLRYASSFLGHHEEALGPRTTTCILINFISIGYILNPFAFSQGGLILSTICLGLVSFQSYISGLFVLEACARAEALKRLLSASEDTTISKEAIAVFQTNSNQDEQQSIHEEEEDTNHVHVIEGEDMDPNSISIDPFEGKESAAQDHNKSNEEEATQQQNVHGFTIKIENRTFEISELCRIFLGTRLKYFFTFTACGDLYGVTWALAVVFASSFADQVPLLGSDTNNNDLNYQLFIIIFIVICVPLSCLGIVGQVRFQLLFLAGRTLMILFMIGTTIVAYLSDKSHFAYLVKPDEDHVTLLLPLVNFSNIVSVLQTCVFATAFQFSVPGVAAETKDKSRMPSIIKNSVAYILITNVFLSCLLASFFGPDNMQESSNLNWVQYHGGTWDGEEISTRSWWASCISVYVVSFAAFDGLAVYPLIAMSLGDILMGAFYGDQVHDIDHRTTGSTSSIHTKKRIIFKILASLPQGIGAMFVRDLGVISLYAGIFTVLSYTVCPALLAIQSRKMMFQSGLGKETSYQTSFSSSMWAWVLLVPASFLIIAVIIGPLLVF